MRSVRKHADRLALDYGHFTGQRRWTDDQLAGAVAGARSWEEVVDVLGLADQSSQVTLRGHAARLKLDVAHLRREPQRHGPAVAMSADLGNLPQASSLVAAAWFAMCGYTVSWPLEPARYDLLTHRDGELQRIQVKTTSVRAGESWQVWLSTTGRGRTVYDPEEIDFFFVVDGELSFYLIPVDVVGGLHAITLSAYSRFRVREGAGPCWS